MPRVELEPVSPPIGDMDDAPPEATVVVLGYNGRRYVDACLSSLRDQLPDTPAFEVVFFDNASTDGTPDLVATAYSWVRLVRSDRNLGYAAGNIAALSHVRSRHVAFLNQDTVVGRSWLRALLAAARETGAAGVHGSMILPWQQCFGSFDPASPHGHVHLAELTRAAYVGYAVADGPARTQTLFLSGAAFLIDRAVLSRVGGLFDPDFWAYCEDTDLALRLRAAGETVVLAGDAVFAHHLTPADTVSLRAIAKTVRILRNRHLACLRSMTAAEYLRILPALVLGSGGKADHIPTHGIAARVVPLGMIALAVAGLAWALASLPRHRAWRARTLASRSGGPTAIADALAAADADLTAWSQRPTG